MGINKDSQKAPNLRFKGFTDDWEQRNWSSTVNMSTNMVDPKDGRYDNLPHIGPGNIESFSGRILNNVHTVKEDNLISGKFHFKENDIIYGKINPQLAKYAYVNFEGLASADTYVLNSKKDLDQNFLFFELQTDRFYKYSVSVSMRTGMPKVNRDELNQYKYLLPNNISEQRLIGTLFKNIDKTITLHQRKLEQLNQLKEALLQQMFPGKGETVPKLRFAGFEGDWEERKLKNIGLIQTGNTPPTKNKDNYSDTGMLWVTPTDINHLIISDTEKRLSNIGIEKARIAKKGSILVTCIASIGKNALAMTDVGFNQQINSLTPQRGYDSYFLLTQSKIWSETMKNNAASGTMQIVNKTDFSNIISSFPTVEEQRRIGLLFNKVDTTITLQQRKLDQLKNTKQVLLQNMFI